MAVTRIQTVGDSPLRAAATGAVAIAILRQCQQQNRSFISWMENQSSGDADLEEPQLALPTQTRPIR
eukprot:16615-Heterococcus_DN1.PRE.7